MVNVLCVDAAFTHMGLAVVGLGVVDSLVHAETIVTERNSAKKNIRVACDDAERCAVIWRGLLRVAGAYDIKALVAELPTGSQSARAAKCLGASTALIVAAVEALGLPSVWTSPEDGKRAFTGSKQASKPAMIAAALSKWPGLLRHVSNDKGKLIKDKAEHMADALAAFEVARLDPVLRVLRGQV